MQLSELRESASRRDWTITNEYVDHEVSGSKESRPELNQLMADAHRASSMPCSFGKLIASVAR
jgi:DNA invertase Pin-like site-specific DNA recombinase